MASVFGSAALPFISCIALLVAAVLIVLGFAAPRWAYDGDDYVGLWRLDSCKDTEYIKCYLWDQPSWNYVPDWLHAVRGMASLSIIFVAIPLITLPVYMYIALGMYFRCMMATMACSSLLCTVTGVIGIIIYGINANNLNWEVSWSLFVTIAGCFCAFIGFLVLVVTLCSQRPESIKQPYYPTTILIDPHKDKLYTVRIDDN